MARETKVGLLAGLTFIICFAIILANRSGQGRIAQQMPTFVKQAPKPIPQPNANGRRSTNDQPMYGQPANARRMSPVSSQRPIGNATTYNNRPRTDVAANRGRANDPRVLQSTQVESASGQDRNRQVLRRDNSPSESIRGEEPLRNDVPHDSTARQVTSQPMNPLAQQGRSSLANTPPAVGFVPRVSAEGRAAFAAATKPPQKAPAKTANRRTHRVRGGDTLTRIAQEYYGSRSGKLVKALFEANQSVMSSPDLLVVGKVLVLPQVAGFQAPDKAAGGKPSTAMQKPTQSKSKPKNNSPTRWYQIKENDRYETIANRELKDAKRWREIYELNRKIFPDPNRIQSGVRIRLPVTKVADARERRR